MDVTANPVVLTIATVHAGGAQQHHPEELVMTGTLRTFDPANTPTSPAGPAVW
jgi:amidohydrolase